jgi:hypothetical protein
MREELRVFRDPTMREFFSIFYNRFNRKLPLYVHLYFLRECVRYVEWNFNKWAVPSMLFMYGFNVGYWAVFNRYMMMNQVKFFSISRIFVTFLMTYSMISYQTSTNIDSYKVDINNLFDVDEPFLFKNKHFMSVLKNLCVNHSDLVNDNFDLTSIALNPNVEVKTPDGFDITPSSYIVSYVTLIGLTFNTANNIAAYQKFKIMMANYEVKFRKVHEKLRKKMFLDNPNQPFVKELRAQL